jgi:hypothetical protein
MTPWRDQRYRRPPGPVRARLEDATSSLDLAREAPGLFSIGEAAELRSLNQLVAHAAREVRACCGAAAVLWRGGELAGTAASHPSLPELIEVQLRRGRGPMLDALGTGEPAGCPDTLDDRQWPEFARRALRQGVRCSLSLAHRSGADVICLSLFGARPRALDAESVAAAEQLVAFGGVVVGVASEYGEARRTAQQLRDATESRAVVDQAKGILMHALGCSADQALQRMRQISQARNVKVTEVAARIIDARGVDGLAVPRHG